MTYHHLTQHERTQFGALLQLNRKIPEISKQLGRNKSTFYREFNRNSVDGVYCAEVAQESADSRRTEASSDRPVDDKLWDKVEKGLKHGMSPEQVSGRLKVEEVDTISASSIYIHIRRDRENGGELWRYLRRSGKTYRQKYGSGTGTESGIKNRKSIEKRPEIVKLRVRHGDIEADTMIGAKHKGVILTLNDRVTQKLVLEKLKSKEAAGVCEAMVKATNRFQGKIHTCTLDNGKEFAAHQDFTKATGAAVYFCHPMSPHERGSNENMNGLIRQYLPKGTDLSSVTDERLQEIANLLNTRPRKTLSYLTPIEIESGGKLKFYFFS
jgi:transposase, IS30 family